MPLYVISSAPVLISFALPVSIRIKFAIYSALALVLDFICCPSGNLLYPCGNISSPNQFLFNIICIQGLANVGAASPGIICINDCPTYSAATPGLFFIIPSYIPVAMLPNTPKS